MPYSINRWADFITESTKSENQPITFYDIQLKDNDTFSLSGTGVLSNDGNYGILTDSTKNFLEKLVKWNIESNTITHLTASSFKLSGNQAANYDVGTQIKAEIDTNDFAYNTVDSYSYDSTNNETTIVLKIPNLLVSLSNVWYGSFWGTVLNVKDEFFKIISSCTSTTITVSENFTNTGSKAYTAENKVYLCEGEKALDLTLASGTEKTHTPFPIRHGEISTNSTGEIDSINITLSDATQQISLWLDSNNGLRGCKVIIRKSFRDIIDQAGAYMEDTFYINSTVVSEGDCIFTLTSLFDLNEIKLPRRKFQRWQCPWKYKKEGCWIINPDSDSMKTEIDYTDKSGWQLIQDIREHINCPSKLRSFLNNIIAKRNTMETEIAAKEVDPSFSEKIDFVPWLDNYMVEQRELLNNSEIPFIDLAFFPDRMNSNKAQNPNRLWITLFFLHKIMDWLNGRRIFDNEPSELYTPIRNYFKPPGFEEEDDVCDKSFDGPKGCKYHNNIRRFGGFPTIPYQKLFFLA